MLKAYDDDKKSTLITNVENAAHISYNGIFAGYRRQWNSIMFHTSFFENNLYSDNSSIKAQTMRYYGI